MVLEVSTKLYAGESDSRYGRRPCFKVALRLQGFTELAGMLYNLKYCCKFVITSGNDHLHGSRS